MKINLSAVAPRILRSRGTPSKFVLYVLKDMYAKFGAFTRFVTIFVNFDANGLDYNLSSHAGKNWNSWYCFLTYLSPNQNDSGP